MKDEIQNQLGQIEESSQSHHTDLTLFLLHLQLQGANRGLVSRLYFVDSLLRILLEGFLHRFLHLTPTNPTIIIKSQENIEQFDAIDKSAKRTQRNQTQ
jgi:hypothetical protein